MTISICAHSHSHGCKGARLSLAAHPPLQARLAQELQEAGLLASKQQPSPRDLTFADLSALHYLDAVCPLRRPVAEQSHQAACIILAC